MVGSGCVLLLVSLSVVTGALVPGRWLIFGGFTDDMPISQVELLTLSPQSSYSIASQWCSRNLSKMAVPLDGATVNYMSVFDFLSLPANTIKPYDGIIWDRALICGGADDTYTIQNKCRWWLPETDTYVEQGPTMMVPRYQAATYYKADQGFLWMMGGRTGSNILADNEILWLPQSTGSSAGSSIPGARKINKWIWLNKLALDSAGWAALPGGLTTLPIPLAGHCVVSVQYSGREMALVTGGGTTQTVAYANGTLTQVPYTGPVPTNHVHLYDFQNNQWISTFAASPTISKMNVARMNHGCVAFQEGSVWKVMVAGGIGLGAGNQTVPLNSVETITLPPAASPGATWFQEAALPNLLTGTKMIVVNTRPTIVGRFGDEENNRMYRYTTTQTWEPLAATISGGRGDIQIVPDFTNVVPVLPIPSVNTMATQGTGYNFLPGNMRTFLPVTTGQDQNPWIQLDFGVNITITSVTFTSAAACASGCVTGFPLQKSEIRVGYTPVQYDQTGPITVNQPCATIDGSTTTTASCNLVGQYLTLQLKDTNTAPVNLAVKELRVYAATPTCP